MNTLNLNRNYALALAIAGSLLIAPAMAKKEGNGHGKGKSDRSEHSESKSDRSDRSESKSDRVERAERRDHFEDRHRSAIHSYYDGQFRKGQCPPGLAKKHNGCLPPGQAKKWQVGQQLPRGVTVYNVPQPLVQQLGNPPAGYRYVRVGSDIYLMSTASRTIVDAILNLGRS